MNPPVSLVSDAQLLERLIQEYTHATDSEVIRTIKAELYRRGYQRSDVVEAAIAAMLRKQGAGYMTAAHLN